MLNYNDFVRQPITESSLRFNASRVPPKLKAVLGKSWMDDVIGYDFSDKGFNLQFKTKVSKRELAKQLKIQDYLIDDEGNNLFFIDDQE